MADREDSNNDSGQEPPSGISRRAFIQGVIAASAATGVVALAEPGAAVPQSAGAVLTAEQASRLTLVLDRLIPADGPMPAAGALGIGGFIDKALVAAPNLRPQILG